MFAGFFYGNESTVSQDNFYGSVLLKRSNSLREIDGEAVWSFHNAVRNTDAVAGVSIVIQCLEKSGNIDNTWMSFIDGACYQVDGGNNTFAGS